MTRLKHMELYDRGLKSFASLSPFERDAFVLNDLDIYHEMEGDFADYLLSGAHEPELLWLDDTLQRIGDADSAAIISQLRQMDDSRRDDITPLRKRYYDLSHIRWELLTRYLARQSVEIDEHE